MTQVFQVVWVVQVVTLARTTSLDDMHSENIWFSWYKPSKYRKKLICHACDGGRRTDGRRKVENRAVFCWTRNRKKEHAHVCQRKANTSEYYVSTGMSRNNLFGLRTRRLAATGRIFPSHPIPSHPIPSHPISSHSSTGRVFSSLAPRSPRSAPRTPT